MVIDNLLEQYELAGIVHRYMPVACPCGETYAPTEKACIACGRPMTDASPTNVPCGRILLQPAKPAYDPHVQSDSPKVFISYRHTDCEILAADIYYSLLADGQSIFLDDGQIPV